MNNDHAKFTEDMTRQGFDVEDYHGRNFWTGPAVRYDGDPDELQRWTSVELTWDTLGLGYIVHPVAR